ncbi:MAG: ankyrin repeat domain-containing protein [Chloroflexota bacterium]|nr:ankyrin repeat domain-containing protein [Chloroflexota bacterium]
MLDCIARRDTQCLEALLAAGAPVDGSARARLVARDQPTPLLAAVSAGLTEIVVRLLDHGADPNLETATWMSPLAVACQRGDRTMAELLIGRGADVNAARSKHASPIEAAAWYGHGDLVSVLLDQGANPDRVFARGVGSLVRIRRAILEQLVVAGGHAPPEVVAFLDEERATSEAREEAT